MKYSIKEIKPNIFLVQFKDQYDLCLTFLRYQEFYESPNKAFRNHSFTIIDFMSWYQKAFGDGSFTYPVDWAGFNFPDFIVPNVIAAKIIDKNIYDKTMLNIYSFCKKQSKTKPFYIIATIKDKDNLTTINHEVAHAMFYLNKDYKKETLNLIKIIDPFLIKTFQSWLKLKGYTSAVYKDEIQAYLSTSNNFFSWFGEDAGNQLNDLSVEFKNVFDKYNNK